MDADESAAYEPQSNPLSIIITGEVFKQRLIRERAKGFPEGHLRGRRGRDLRGEMKFDEIGINIFLN